MRREGKGGRMEDKQGRVRGREGCTTKSVSPLELLWW